MIEAGTPSCETLYETVALLLTEGVAENDYLAPIKKAPSYKEITPLIVKRIALALRAFHKNLPLYFTAHRIGVLIKDTGALKESDQANPYYGYLVEIEAILNEWYMHLEQQL